MMSEDNSRTWSIHLRHLCRIYSITDPLKLMEEPAWTKGRWKTYTTTLVTTYHEKKLRETAINNSKMDLLNVAVTGLCGLPHPIMAGVDTTRDVKKLRPQIKMLAGDYLTYGTLAKQGDGTGGHCRICSVGTWEDTRHILTECLVTKTVRDRSWILPELREALTEVQPTININKLMEDESLLTQFLVDCSSLNLPNDTRLSVDNPHITVIFSITRDLCYSSHNVRVKKLKEGNFIMNNKC